MPETGLRYFTEFFRDNSIFSTVRRVLVTYIILYTVAKRIETRHTRVVIFCRNSGSCAAKNMLIIVEQASNRI